MDVIKPFDPWKSPLCTCPPKYTLNPITGCGHKCLYCYITSYIRDAFNPRVKKDIIWRVERDLRRLKKGSIIAISYSSDPYSPPEDRVKVMPVILKLMKEYKMKVLIATKSVLVIRDASLIRDLNAVVSISVTTPYDDISRIIEPNAPLSSERLKAISKLSDMGIPVSLRIDPIIPYLTDSFDALKRLVKKGIDAGIKHVVSSIYKAKPDSLKRLCNAFPEYSKLWRKLYLIDGSRIYGYYYTPYSYRVKILRELREIVTKYNIEFTTCREGLFHLDTPRTYCDASHLLK